MGYGFAVAVDQEFIEVPGDFAAGGVVASGEILIEGGFVVADDVDFGEEGEGYAVYAAAEFEDFFFCAGFLSAEIVAGKAENDEAVVFVFAVEGFEAFVLFGVAAFAGDVDDEQDFAFIFGEGGDGGGVGGFHGFYGDVVHVFGCNSGCGNGVGGWRGEGGGCVLGGHGGGEGEGSYQQWGGNGAELHGFSPIYNKESLVVRYQLWLAVARCQFIGAGRLQRSTPLSPSTSWRRT